jgi:DNA-binding CsgD family transcriptional regulator
MADTNTQTKLRTSEEIAELFSLTPTEARICEFLLSGNTRSDLKRLLGLNDNCLKWHLKQLYAKTVGDNPLERDKLHRLTVLLWRVKNCEDYT